MSVTTRLTKPLAALWRRLDGSGEGRATDHPRGAVCGSFWATLLKGVLRRIGPKTVEDNALQKVLSRAVVALRSLDDGRMNIGVSRTWTFALSRRFSHSR
jgi:hypothetical protein